MKEVLQRGDYKIGETITQDGRTVAQDIHLVLGEKPYILTVATRRYIRQTEKHNRRLPGDDPTRMNLSVLAVRRIGDERQLLSALSRMPFAKLEPFLIEQKRHLKA